MSSTAVTPSNCLVMFCSRTCATPYGTPLSWGGRATREGANLLRMQDPVTATTEIDLDAIETDLADVETALARLEAGTYWTDEISGQPLPDELLAEHPTARRLPQTPQTPQTPQSQTPQP